MKIRGVTLGSWRHNESRQFLVSTFASYLALIFLRLGGQGRVKVGENGQNSEGVQLQPAAKFSSLVILLCIRREYFAHVKCGSTVSGYRKCCDCRQSHLLCDLPRVLADKSQVQLYVVELVLPENFVPSIKTLHECLM